MVIITVCLSFSVHLAVGVLQELVREMVASDIELFRKNPTA